MPTPTYDLISSTTLAASSLEVVFGSLPQTYRDLVLVINGANTAVGDVALRYNGDSGNNYSLVNMYGTGSSPASGNNSATSQAVLHYNNTTSRYVITASIMDYSATDKHKTAISRGNQADGFVMSYATRWANTAAITSVLVRTDGTNFLTGTTFNLYGIAS